MNTLTLEEFNKIKSETVFARGIEENSPNGIFMTRQGGLLRWVAIKGYGNDWTVYCHWDYQTEQYVIDSGDKVTNKDTIRKLVSCTEEVYNLYRS